MAKDTTYKCSACGTEYSKWMGQCGVCGEWNTIEEKTELQKGSTSVANINKISELKELDLLRISTNFSEFDRVLGSTDPFSKKIDTGLAVGSVNLISGDPGIGKSTLLLQVCANLAKSGKPTVYASAEESLIQIAMRAKRLGLKKTELDKINFINDYDIDSIINALDEIKPEVLILDSIQTISTKQATGLPGGVSQVKACSSKIIQYVKKNGISAFIVGHITKEGNIAGPKVLEHLVDGVFQLEGEKNTDLRILRSLKNRFGATNEVGVFKMDEGGLEDVTNPEDFFITGDTLPGVTKGVVLEGNRIIVVEVQSLVTPTVYPLPKRLGEGVSVGRIQLICAILQRYLRINFSDKDVYVNIAGGLRIDDRGIDLAIAASLISSIKNIAYSNKLVFIGEIALTGALGKTQGEANKMKESKRLGYKIISSQNTRNIADLISHLK